ncbi:MAG: DUF3025 domain-containing protein [Nitrosomonas sp.]|nr:DUF3025 domain-containing protein [Nitrosomonas sp.]
MSQKNWNAYFIALSPIFEPCIQFKEWIEGLREWPTHDDFNRLMMFGHSVIKTHSDRVIRFVPPISTSKNKIKNSAENSYETKIYTTGEIPTRLHNWHDFFNALVWQLFPAAKAALNFLHFNDLKTEFVQNNQRRSPLRDAATIFDESGIIVVSSNARLINLLQAFRWEELFWQERVNVLSAMRFYVFGHGLYEKALNPYVGMTGKGICFEVPDGFFDQTLPRQLMEIDRLLEQRLLDGFSSNADLTPVPLLGYPGWDKNNNDFAYYQNKNYFRM